MVTMLCVLWAPTGLAPSAMCVRLSAALARITTNCHTRLHQCCTSGAGRLAAECCSSALALPCSRMPMQRVSPARAEHASTHGSHCALCVQVLRLTVAMHATSTYHAPCAQVLQLDSFESGHAFQASIEKEAVRPQERVLRLAKEVCGQFSTFKANCCNWDRVHMYSFDKSSSCLRLCGRRSVCCAWPRGCATNASLA
jgi:hypothetical protein